MPLFRPFLILTTLPAALLLAWSDCAAANFVRADVDANGRIEITDPVRILGFLFLGSPTALLCEDAADADDDGRLNISDAVYTLNYLFSTGTAPPPPAACGSDPTDSDPLGCEAFARCPAGAPVRITSTSPLHGETGVALRRETVLVLDDRVDPGTVTR